MKITIRSIDFKLTEFLEANLNRNIKQALSHMQHQIDEIIVSIRDLNGPKGGTDKSIVLRINPIAGRSVLVSGRGDDLYTLIGEVSRRAKAIFSKKHEKTKIINKNFLKKVA